MSNIKIIKMSGNHVKLNDTKPISGKVGRRSPAHHHDRNKSVVKSYRAGYPQKNIAAKIDVSVRQVALRIRL